MNLLTKPVADMDLRELNALDLAARSQIICRDGVWFVPSQATPSKKYRVVLAGDQPTCECEDFQLRREPCKHIMAARFVKLRDGGKNPQTLDTSYVPKKPTYKQNWPKYNQAQITEKERFQELLYDLCRTVEETALPAKGKGRRRIPVSDVVFACAFKVYSLFSTRRFGSDLKAAFERGYLTHLMHPVGISRFFETEAMSPILTELVARSSLPLAALETKFSPDSTGFSTSRFIKWFDEKYGQRSERHWVKVHLVTGVKTNIVTAVRILERDAADSPQFKPLVETTAANFKIEEVSADKAYLSHENLELVEKLGGTPFVPFKSNSVVGEGTSIWQRMYHYYQLKRDDFLKHYHLRSNVESTVSMIKAKFGDGVRSKIDVAMKNEALCKLLCHNICVVHQSQVELGIETEFFPKAGEQAGSDDGQAGPDVLPLTRPG